MVLKKLLFQQHSFHCPLSLKNLQSTPWSRCESSDQDPSKSFNYFQSSVWLLHALDIWGQCLLSFLPTYSIHSYCFCSTKPVLQDNCSSSTSSMHSVQVLRLLQITSIHQSFCMIYCIGPSNAIYASFNPIVPPYLRAAFLTSMQPSVPAQK